MWSVALGWCKNREHFSFNGTLIGSNCRKKGGIMPRLSSASLLKSFSWPPLQDGRLSRTVGWAGGTALHHLNCLWSCSVACWPLHILIYDRCQAMDLSSQSITVLKWSKARSSLPLASHFHPGCCPSGARSCQQPRELCSALDCAAV